MIPPERSEPTPADHFEAYLHDVEARELPRPRLPRSTRLQIAVALALGLVLWDVILAGLSRRVLGWP